MVGCQLYQSFGILSITQCDRNNWP